MAIDAGGTMIDDFIVDSRGEFVVGKAQTTPDDESVGFFRAMQDGLSYWGLAAETALGTMVSGVYSGTAMLNRLLSRQGSRVGLLVTAGMEDTLILERGVQTHLGLSYADRLHVATHSHNPPLVPKERIRGIYGRIDIAGDTVLPLNEAAARKAVTELLQLGIESLCVCLLHSYRNPAHELTVREIAEEVMAELGLDTPIFLSSERYPMRGDLPRLNTLLVDAYAAEPSREQVRRIQERSRQLGAPYQLRIMATHGGTVSTGCKELARTLISGPIGGVVGGRHLAAQLGKKNVVCTDIGGTSFDVGLLTEGELAINPNPEIARFVLSIPLVQVDSIGAGTGSFIRINPTNSRIELGPDSAGSRIGVCWPEGGIDTPTITDCHVVLGYLDPQYFLGGEVKLDPERARQALQEQVARPLGLGVEEAAEGVIAILEENLKNQLHASIVGKGYSPMSYTLLCYGGGGPLHVAGLSRGLGFEDILIPMWAAGFSAYGCATADFEYRGDISIDLPLQAGISEEEKGGIVELINGQAMFLQARVADEFDKSGIDAGEIDYSLRLRIQYLGQLNDLEVDCGRAMLAGPADLDRMIAEFEELYAKIYALAARLSELGYLLTTVVVVGRVAVEKPLLPRRQLKKDKTPPESAEKAARSVYWQGKWITADIFEMDKLEPGNEIHGLAVIEAPSTTLMVPPDRLVVLDEHLIFHLKARAVEDKP